MPKLITHKFVSTIPDGDDTGLVRPSNWNDTHDVSGVAESGTNTDITSMTGITGGISSPNFVQFDTTAAESSVTGKLFWDDGDGVLSNGLKGGNVTLQIGTQEFARVFNDSGTTLTKGQAVYISGAQGNRVAVKLARADAEATSFGTIGLVAETMTNGAEGFIIVSGALYKLDTLGLVAGATVYLSPTTAGALTTTKPQAPQQLVVVGWVERVNATVGSIYVKVDNGYELDELHDVKIVSPTTGQTLVYDQPTGIWNNSNAPTIIGGTINGTTIGATTPSSIVGTTITGQTGVLRGTGQNFLTFSQTFQNAAWIKQANVTPTDNTTVAPDGTTTAATIAWGSASNGTGLYNQRTGLSFTGITNTKSIYVRADVGGGTVQLTDPGNTIGTTTLTLTTDWQRVTLSESGQTAIAGVWIKKTASSPSTIYLWGGQLEVGSVANTYIPTTTTAVYGTPTLSFSGVSEIGLQSNGALYLQPAGTGAIQAQATTSTTAGGNARGANAVDWQTSRSTAAQVASASQSVLVGGSSNTASGQYSSVLGGVSVTASGFASTGVGGWSNSTSGTGAFLGGGRLNTSAGYWNFIGCGYGNSATSGSAVTTQSGTMNGTTAVTLSGSNASIKVGQYITGTSIANDTYVAAISGTSLTLSQAASGSSTSTLSFFTPHGVVVGGGNNQATGSYSFIGGGGDAGTAANRNVASGDWSVVAGGQKNVASGLASFIGGGGNDGSIGGNTASGTNATVVGGNVNLASGFASFVANGYGHVASGSYSSVLGGAWGTTRSIVGFVSAPASQNPISGGVGVQQTGLLVLGRQTTDATATVLTSNTAAAGTTNQVILPNNSAYYFKIEVIAGKTAAGDSKAWELKGAIKRGANAGTTTLIGTVTSTVIGEDAGASAWTAVATADTTNGGIKLTVTGQASTTIRWVARCTTVEMTF